MTRLGFQVDQTAVARYDSTLREMQRAAESTADRIRTALAGAAVLAVTAIGATVPVLAATARAGDEMTGNLNKLEGALGSAERAGQIYEQLYQVVRQTGAEIGETTTAFGNYNLAMSKNGKSAEDTVRLIGGLQAAMSSLGVSTQQVSSVTMQLGQALGKGVLNGDELVSLREAMPQLVDELRKALKLTDAQFSKAAEKGELTAEKLIGPLLAYADTARQKLLDLPPTMARSTAILSNTWKQVLADLDKALGLSQFLASNLGGVSDWLEGLRSRLPALGKFIKEIGGLRSILRVLAYTIGIGTAALAAFNAALLVTITRSLMAYAAIAAPWVLAAGAVTALGVMLDDFVQWVQGNTAGTLFGEWFGDFDALVQPVRNALANLKAWVNRQIEGMKPQVEWFTYAIGTLWAGSATALMAAWRPVSEFFNTLWDGITRRFESAWQTVKPIVDAVNAAASALKLGGSGPIQEGEERAPRRGGLNRSGKLEGFPEVPAEPMSAEPGRPRASPIRWMQDKTEEMAPMLRAGMSYTAGNANSPAVARLMPASTTSTVNAPMTVTQNINVQATGVSGAEVAAGAKAGVDQAASNLTSNFDRLARQVGMSMPDAETAWSAA
ncbi:tape measure protein [Teichococcus wenyumeiae]|nr:tape measure protein [Pseudoroseomonas wenyumeiae]